MKIVYMVVMVVVVLSVIVGLSYFLTGLAENASANYYTPENGYIVPGIRKLEIENKYVCFIRTHADGISCVQKLGE